MSGYAPPGGAYTCDGSGQRNDCIFPQPGCDIDALESAEWRTSATEILKKYNALLGKEGTRHQGCCCGHTHRLLSTQAAQRLRDAGFLVENDKDPEEDA